MWLDEEKPILKRDLVLPQPLVNASGTLGFAPDPRMPALAQLGAFITNPISTRPRKPAAKRDYLPFQGGFLLHSGLPNPGIHQVIRRYRRRWAAADLPIIVHVLVESPNTLVEMVRKLEGLDNILAIELGLPPACDPAGLSAIMATGAGELPLIPCLGPEQVALLLDTLIDLGPAAVHLVEPRGALPNVGGQMVSGRLYGPAIFPFMLKAAQELVAAGLCVIANGGIVARWQVDALMATGVMAVGLGSVLWGIDLDGLF
jgi:dihydroorotate dehydrogenase (NAD+) catalytic subunit